MQMAAPWTDLMERIGVLNFFISELRRTEVGPRPVKGNGVRRSTDERVTFS
jgi:hypothetical protein